jgi:hypothetical protein
MIEVAIGTVMERTDRSNDCSRYDDGSNEKSDVITDDRSDCTSDEGSDDGSDDRSGDRSDIRSDNRSDNRIRAWPLYTDYGPGNME